MLRTIITIDEEACIGCGLCVDACHEGAIALIDGKARLIRDDYCDGLGNCLPVCPVDAIHMEEREAAAYDEQAVLAAQRNAKPASVSSTVKGRDREPSPVLTASPSPSELDHWPIQIKLVATGAACFKGCNLLIAADCSAFTYANFHADFMRGKTVLIGCPKLDDVDYGEKLSAIIAENDISSVTVTRMEVPCCGGIEFATRRAIENSGKAIPLDIVTFSLTGEIL